MMRYLLAALAVLAVGALAAMGTALLSDRVAEAERRAPLAEPGAEPRDAGQRRFRGGTPPPGQTLPRFRLPDHLGRTLAPGDLAGRVVLVTFLDTQCTDACPVIASQLGTALRLLTPEERRRVVALAVTSDPAEDTPANVKAFLRDHDARDVRYLLGAERELRPVWKAFHVLPSADSGDDEVHSAPVRVFDTSGVWVTSLHPGADLTPRNLAHDIRVALG